MIAGVLAGAASGVVGGGGGGGGGGNSLDMSQADSSQATAGLDDYSTRSFAQRMIFNNSQPIWQNPLFYLSLGIGGFALYKAVH